LIRFLRRRTFIKKTDTAVKTKVGGFVSVFFKKKLIVEKFLSLQSVAA